MSDDRARVEGKVGTRSPVRTSGSTNAGNRAMGFDCCGIRMDDAIAGCPCASLMRKHPIVTFTVLALMGLAALVVTTGVALGFIAFLRTL